MIKDETTYLNALENEVESLVVLPTLKIHDLEYSVSILSWLNATASLSRTTFPFGRAFLLSFHCCYLLFTTSLFQYPNKHLSCPSYIHISLCLL